MTLRDYRPADFRRLCEIDRLCFEPKAAYSASEMAALLGARGSLAIVAENRRGRIVAFVGAERRRDGPARLITLDVLPRYRKRGLGRELLLRCEQRLRAAGARSVRLETAVANRAAQALYLSLGYTFVKRLPRYYANGEDAWAMEKELEA